jgi:hypothetical protein
LNSEPDPAVSVFFSFALVRQINSFKANKVAGTKPSRHHLHSGESNKLFSIKELLNSIRVDHVEIFVDFPVSSHRHTVDGHSFG